MKSFFSKNKKKIIAISLMVFLVSSFFLYPNVASAEDGENVARVLGWILFPFIWIMGQLATMLLGILIKIAQYNGFINSAAVSYGWIVVRDLCNMFFVLILLIIAFASILRVDSYNLKTWLPKLVIMAVLINFSKLICGVFIDFAQVIMLTFVNAFKDIAGANLTDMLGISKILTFSGGGFEGSKVSAWSIIGSMVLALIISVIAVVVILSMLAMLAMRVVLLWIYVVLSPLAYLMAAFPQGQSNSQRWWSDFSKNLIVGPVLAFFIWLSFVSLGGVEGETEIAKIREGKEVKNVFVDDSSKNAQVLTEAGSPDNMIKMIISIGMLLGGLMLAQEMGDRSGKIAGKGLAKLQTMGAGALKRGKNVGAFMGKRTAEAGLGVAGATLGGKDTQAGRFLKGWSGDMKATRGKKAVKDRQDFMESMGMGEKAGVAGKELTDTIKTSLNIGDKRGKQKVKEGSQKIKSGEEDVALATNLEDAQSDYNKLDQQFQILGRVQDGKTKIEEGNKDFSDGNENLAKAKNLKKAQRDYDNFDQKVASLSAQGQIGTPAYISAVNSRDEAGDDLKEAKRDAGIDENATRADTISALNQLKTEGNDKINNGKAKIDQGKDEVRDNTNLLDPEVKKKGDAAFTDVAQSRNKAETNLKELRVKAGISENSTEQETLNVVAGLRAGGNQKINEGNIQVEAGRENLGGYGKFGTFLIGNTNKAFKKMGEDYEKANNFTEVLANENPPFSDMDNGKFSKSDGSINTEQKNVWDNLNNNKHDKAATNLNELVKGVLFDRNGDAKKDIKDADKGKINSIARGLKTYESSGAKLSPELKVLKTLLNDYSRKSGGVIKSVDERKAGAYRISGVEKPSNNMDVNESGIGSINEFGRNRGQSDTISYNFDKLAAKGLDVNTNAEGVYLKGESKDKGVYLEGDIKDKVKIEIISDIDKELEALKNKSLSAQGLNIGEKNNVKNLESAKARLEAGDNFSLVNANKKMGLSETVVTKGHEAVHEKIDKIREDNNFTPSQKQKDEEEDLAEYYGKKTRENQITNAATDQIVAKIIFDGQKNGRTNEQIKLDIDKVTDKYKPKTKDGVLSVQEDLEQNIQVDNIIKNETEAMEKSADFSYVMPDMSESFNSIGDSIKDSFSSVKGSVNELKRTSDSIKVAQNIQERIDWYRFQQLKKIKK